MYTEYLIKDITPGFIYKEVTPGLISDTEPSILGRVTSAINNGETTGT